MNSAFFIAKRYLFSKNRIKFISIISYLSVGGITVGVAALIIVLAVFNGFSGLVRSLLVNFDPHVRIEAATAADLKTLDSLKSYISSQKNVVSYSPFSEGKVMIMTSKFSRVITLRGADTETGKGVYNLQGTTVLGKSDLSESESGHTPILVGIQLADKMQILPGDVISIVSPFGIENVAAGLAPPKSLTCEVAGIFSVQNNDYDDGLMFAPLEDASDLLGYGSNFQGWDIKLSNYEGADSFVESFQKTFGTQSYKVKTWYDFHKDLYTMMQVERWVAYILLSLIILVAVFNTLASLTMSVQSKRRDIGILSTLGMNRESIRKIFLYQGVMIGFIGTIGGFLLAFAIYYLHQKYNIYPLDATRFRISAMPMELHWADFLVTGLMSFFLSVISSLYPAKRAAESDPLQAIRYE